MKRKIIVAALALIFLALSFIFYKSMSSRSKPESEIRIFDQTKYVRVDTVEYSTQNTLISGYGRVIPNQKVKIFSEVQGIMLKTNKVFKEGTNFKKGELLIDIDDRLPNLNLLTMKSEFLSQLTSAMPDIKIDFPEFASAWEAYLQKFNFEDTIAPLPEIKNDKLKYFLAARNIFRSYYNIQTSELNLSKHKIYAPFDGVVVSSNYEIGSLIRPQVELGEFSALGTFELELPLSVNDLAFINIGGKVKVFETAERIVNGTISRISGSIDPSTQSTNVYIVFQSNLAKEGQYLKAEAQGGDIDNIFSIPRQALHNNNTVFTIVDSKLVATNVEVIRLSDEFVFIRGLPEKTCIIIDPLTEAIVGMKVLPIN